MKNIFLAFFLFSFFTFNAQQEDVNAFQQSENQATETEGGINRADLENKEQGGPGNLPGDDEIPIDDYLPLLAIVGTVLVIYQFKSKKSSTL